MAKKLPTIFVILGPTASGKSDYAVRLAKKIDGEVVSADSRHVYKGLDLCSGKITKKEMRAIPHHLIDIVSVNKSFSVSDFQKKAYFAIDEILARGKTPIICGGTGFYIQAIVDGIILPDVQADKKLRKKLSQKTAEQLFQMLKKVDPKRASSIDPHNKVRLIRAIEIAKNLGKVPALKSKPRYAPIEIGIDLDATILRERIHTRLIQRMKQGMLKEAENLHSSGLSWKRMHLLGLECHYLAEHLQKKISRAVMLDELELAIWHYAKRQMTWFKRDSRITWINNTKDLLYTDTTCHTKK